MKKRVMVSLVVIAVLSAALISASADSPKQKGKDKHADGIWCYMPATLDFLPIADYTGDKAFASFSESGEWTGTFTGESKEYGLAMLQLSEAGLSGSFVGTIVFDSVQVDGASGGLELDVYGDRPDTDSDWVGTWRITDGTGELEGLRGQGAWWGPGYNQEVPDECGVLYYSVKKMDDFNDGGDED